MELGEALNKPGAIIILKNREIPVSKVKQIGMGRQKRVYEIKGEDICFITSTVRPKELLESEKMICDHILSLGIQAQQYEFVPIEVRVDGFSCHSHVLVTQPFSSLTHNGSLTIYDLKNDTIFGKEVECYNGEMKNLNDPAWNQKLLEKIIKEYALALAFSLPIDQVSVHIDDSVHYYFEHPKDSKCPPCARYIFWDVVQDYRGCFLPTVPTLEILRRGNTGYEDRNSPISFQADLNRGLKSLANSLACFISKNKEEKRKLSNENNFIYVKQLGTTLFNAITDRMLQEALEHAREIALPFLLKKMEVEFKNQTQTPTWQAMEKKKKFEILYELSICALSVNHKESIREIFSQINDLNTFSIEYREKILSKAQEFENQEMIDFLASELKPVPTQPKIPSVVESKKYVAKLPKQTIKKKEPSNNWLDKITLRSGLSVLLGINFWFLGYATSTLFAVGAGFFIGSVLLEKARLNFARNSYKEFHTHGRSKPDNRHAPVLHDVEYFHYGRGAERTWHYYCLSYLLPKTYLPYSKQSASFQYGREAAKREIVKEQAKSIPKVANNSFK